MNILLLNGSDYRAALARRGHRVHAAGWAGFLGEGARTPREYSLENAIAEAGFTPDLVLVELFGPRPFVRGLEACPCPLVAYVYDSWFNHFWLRHYLKLFDHVFVDFQDSVPRLAGEGIRAHWLPYAVEPDDFPELRAPKEYDVGFVGVTENRPRRVALLDTLREHFDVRVAGGKSGQGGGRPRLSLRETAEVYARARIVVNECLFEGVNFRVFEGMASGSLLLTEETRRGLPDLFTDGVHLATYRPDTLVERVRYYLEHEEERERIAAAGRRRVLARHTRDRRVETILARIGPTLGRTVTRDARRHRAREAEAAYWFCRRWPILAPREIRNAREALEQALESDPGNGPACWILGLIHAEWGDRGKALAHLGEAAGLLPDEPLVLFHLGHLLGEADERDLALRCFENGLRRASRERRAAVRLVLDRRELGAPLWLELGRLLESTGRATEPNATGEEAPRFPFLASEYFLGAWRRGGGAESLQALGCCLSRAGCAALAQEAFVMALDERPDPETFLRAGVESLKVFRRELGIRLIRAAIRLDPGLRGRIAEAGLRAEEREALLSA